MGRMKDHLRPALFCVAILLLAWLNSGCTTTPQHVGTETATFTLRMIDRDLIPEACGESLRAERLACAVGSTIYLPTAHKQEPSVTRHTVTIHRYPWRASPCVACVRDGEVHAALGDGWWWGGRNAARLGDAIIEATGAPVAFNFAWMLAHELGHVLDQEPPPGHP